MDHISSDRVSTAMICRATLLGQTAIFCRATEIQIAVQGHILLTSPGYSHRLGSVFQEPLKYDPERFRVRAEDKKASSFTA